MEALVDMLTTSQVAATNGLKGASYIYVENIVTGMTLDGTIDGIFIRKLKRWCHVPVSMDAFTQRGLNSRAFTDPLATFVKQKMNNVVDGWHQNT